MPQLTPPFFWPSIAVSYPGAGGNAQSILDNWFSTSVTYAGNSEIESRIVSDVASYGKQLGILSEAVLELAETGRPGPHVERLKAYVERIEQVKERYGQRLDERTTESFGKLAKEDPRRAERLLEELARLLEDARAKRRADGETSA